MKVYAIRDNSGGRTIEIGYFFYYEKSGEYYIELADGLDEWDCPFIIDHYVRKGQSVMNQHESKVFISQRIVPQDRQNIGQILKENGLDEYDEAKLFILADGRCSQDECYIVPITYEKIPKSIRDRKRIIISAVFTPPASFCVSFDDGTIGMVDLADMLPDDRRLERLLAYRNLLEEARISAAGTELVLTDQVRITYDRLYRSVDRKDSMHVPQGDAFRAFLTEHLATTQDVMNMLKCTRQNVNDLVRRQRLVPLELNGKLQVFLKSDVLRLL